LTAALHVFPETTTSRIASAVSDDQQIRGDTREIGGRAACLRRIHNQPDGIGYLDQQFSTRALDRWELTRRSISYTLKNFRHHALVVVDSFCFDLDRVYVAPNKAKCFSIKSQFLLFTFAAPDTRGLCYGS
jgi:hypothetical protein